MVQKKGNLDTARLAFEGVRDVLQRGVNQSELLADWHRYKTGEMPLEQFFAKNPYALEAGERIHDTWRENNKSFLPADHPQMRDFKALSDLDQAKDVDPFINAVAKYATRGCNPS
jgi:hypothetical protein